MTGRRVVVGIDGSSASLHALRVAADLATNGQLIALFCRHVWLSMPPHVAEDLFSEDLAVAEDAAEAAVTEQLAAQPVEWRFVSSDDEPVRALLHASDELEADLIVVGREDWSWLRRLMLGSVSDRLVHESRVPVMVVPAPGDGPKVPSPPTGRGARSES